MFRTFLAVLLANLFLLPCLVQAQPKPDKSGEAQVDEDLLPRTVFQVLLAEMALDRGKREVALGAYADLAKRSKDPRVLERAFDIALENRVFDLALDLSRLWVRIDPKSLRAQQALTTSLVQLDRLDELAAHIPAMIEQDKERLPGHLLYLNRLLARQPDRAAVSRLVQRVAAPYAGVPEAHYAVAVAALAAGETERATTEAAKALELRPDWELAALVYARARLKEGNAEVVRFLKEFLDKYPKAADARLMLARLLLAGKEYAGARQQFERILEDHPNNPEVLYPAAVLAMQQEDKTAARPLLERLLVSQFSDKSAIHYFLAVMDEEEQKLEAALAHFEQVIAGEHYLTARGRAALILARQGRIEESLVVLRRTAARSGEERLRLGMAEASVLREAKRIREAYELQDKMLKEFPDDTELLYEIALTAERLGQFDILEQRLRRLIELKPDNAHALNALGYSFADRAIRLDEAFVLIKKAFDLKPGDPFIMDSLGWVLFRQGKMTEALGYLQEAYKLRPDPEIAAHLGEVLWTLGRQEEAVALWRSAQEKNPTSEPLIRVLKKFQP